MSNFVENLHTVTSLHAIVWVEEKEGCEMEVLGVGWGEMVLCQNAPVHTGASTFKHRSRAASLSWSLWPVTQFKCNEKRPQHVCVLCRCVFRVMCVCARADTVIARTLTFQCAYLSGQNYVYVYSYGQKRVYAFVSAINEHTLTHSFVYSYLQLLPYPAAYILSSLHSSPIQSSLLFSSRVARMHQD